MAAEKREGSLKAKEGASHSAQAPSARATSISEASCQAIESVMEAILLLGGGRGLFGAEGSDADEEATANDAE